MSITSIKLITDGNVEIRTIQIRKNDLIVVKTKNIMKQHMVESAVEEIKKVVGFDVCMCHIQLEEDIDVLTKEQMNVLGWYRKEQLQEKLAPES